MPPVTPILLLAAIAASVCAMTLVLLAHAAPPPVKIVTSSFCPAVEFQPMSGAGFGFPVEP